MRAWPRRLRRALSPRRAREAATLLFALGVGIVGPFAATAATASKSHPLHLWSTWFVLGLVVLTSGVVLYLGAPAFGARPKITVETGTGRDYHYVLSERDLRQAAQLSHQIKDIYTTRLKVRETNKVQAKDVQIRLSLPDGSRPVMQYLDGSDRATIEGGGRAFVRLCELFEYQRVNDPRRPVSHHPDLAPGRSVTFAVEVTVDGNIDRTLRWFKADWERFANFPDVSPLPEVAS